MPKPDPILDLLDDSAESLLSCKGAVLPNVFPRITTLPYRIAIIGEHPSKDDIETKKPFSGYAGKELDRFLSRFGILRDACFLGNVCQHRPEKGSFTEFEWNGPEIQGGIQKLTVDLAKWHPNIVLLLGGGALHAFMAPWEEPKKRKGSGLNEGKLVFSYPNSLDSWRGSFFLSHGSSPLPGVKCMATHHPVACLRNYEWIPLFMLDVSRLKLEANSPELDLPQRDLVVDCSFERIVENLDYLQANCSLFGTDIEGYWNSWSCISFAPSPDYSFIVPFTKMDGSDLWSVEEELVLMQKVARLLADPSKTKVWQNGLYDRFCTQYGYNMPVCGPSHDIMLKHWELYCELEKSLAVQTSIYTKEPYYKADRKTTDRETYWKYCCRDSAVTIEIDQKLDGWLKPNAKKHYEFNLVLLNALLYMELRGIKYNVLAAQSRLRDVEHEIYSLQHQLDTIAGVGIPANTPKATLRALLRDTMCYKRDASKVKEPYKEDYDICMRILLGEGPLTTQDLGRLSVALGKSMNIKGEEFKNYLYETLGLPKQYHQVSGAVTTNYEALIVLRRDHECPALQLAIDIGELRTRAQTLRIATDPDGRIRASYNEVGSETGRVTCSKSPTGTGHNLQTIPDDNELKPESSLLSRGLRDLLTADDGCYIGKCDLKGADGWTIGANLSALGDSTMLEDLRVGLKPANVLCYGRRYGAQEVNKPRATLLELCKVIKKSDWDYFAYKQCVWGFCYLMGVDKACRHVANVSEGSVWVKREDMQAAKDMLFKRYRIDLWHKHLEKKLSTQPYPPSLTSPSGHTRKFFGRAADRLGQALADEPQEVTTYVINMAVYNCWTDPENRVVDSKGRTRLRVEPMHQVHDEFVCQWKIEDTEWAKMKIKQWFNNPVTIAGITLTIPYDGAYGTDWSMSSKSKKGNL